MYSSIFISAELRDLRLLSHADELSEVRLSHVVSTWDTNTGTFVLRDFGITELIKCLILRLQKLQNSIMFLESWRHRLGLFMNTAEESCTVADAVSNVYSQTEEETLHILDSILSGQIYLSELSRWLQTFPRGFQKDQLPSELQTLCQTFDRDVSILQMRLKQIEKYNGIQSNNRVADCLYDLVCKLELEKCKSEIFEIKAMV